MTSQNLYLHMRSENVMFAEGERHGDKGKEQSICKRNFEASSN